MTLIDKTLQEICLWLNQHYIDSKPKTIIRYYDNIALSFWECGVIICISDLLYFLEEDDGTWTSHNGMLDSFNIGWAESFNNALANLQEYVKENGTPVYYNNSDIISNYTL